MADAHVSEACGVTLEGSTPSSRTKILRERLRAYSGWINLVITLISI